MKIFESRSEASKMHAETTQSKRSWSAFFITQLFSILIFVCGYGICCWLAIETRKHFIIDQLDASLRCSVQDECEMLRADSTDLCDWLYYCNYNALLMFALEIFRLMYDIDIFRTEKKLLKVKQLELEINKRSNYAKEKVSAWGVDKASLGSDNMRTVDNLEEFESRTEVELGIIPKVKKD